MMGSQPEFSSAAAPTAITGGLPASEQLSLSSMLFSNSGFGAEALAASSSGIGGGGGGFNNGGNMLSSLSGGGGGFGESGGFLICLN